VQLVVAKDKFNEATTVASSRSRGGNDTLVKPKEDRDAGAGTREENKLKEKLISITTDKDTNAFSDFAKFLEQHLNEHIEKEIKKKLN
jgi:hypothetical protein